MRNFHNWLKSIITYTIVLLNQKIKMVKLKKNHMILDVRGGDVMKWFHARIKSYVGFDPDYEGIYFNRWYYF